MFTHYFIIAWRNFQKYKLYSFLNITGLMVGILSFCYIFLFVKNELSYDNYFAAAERTYRLNFYGKLGERALSTAQTPAPSGPAFKNEIPEIEGMCRLTPNGRSILKYESNSFTEKNVLFADSTFFRVFNFNLVKGNAGNALSGPGKMVISSTTARKYFGNSDPLGKILKVDNDKIYSITGVMEDIPANTHFKADFLLSMASLESSREDNWGSTNYNTYLVLKKGTDPGKVSKISTEIFVKNFSFVLKQYLNTTWEDFTRSGNYARMELFPLLKIHLYSDIDGELDTNGSIRYVYIFSIVGLLILALASINFVNLTTARTAVRLKEVGVRKTIGAVRSGLAVQFLGESIFLAINAWLLAVVAMWLLLPLFNQLSGKQFIPADLFSLPFLLPSFLVGLFTGLLAGLYPALYLSSFKPIKVLKGIGAASGKKSFLRSGLVVFQFFVTTLLLVSALIIYQQLKYIRNKDIGFNKEQVLTINDGYLLKDKVKAFKEKALEFPQVKSVTVSNSIPVTKEPNSTSIIRGRVASPENTFLINNFWVDADFVKTFGITIVEGRDFSSAYVTDSSAVLVNEVLAKNFGYPVKPVVGEEISMPEDSGKLRIYHIAGIMKDFHYSSLKQKIGPLVIFPNGYPTYVSLRLETKDISTIVSHLTDTWKAMAPGQPFSYNFLDEKFAQLYERESRIEAIINVFSVITIIIACLGLLGLVTFMAEQRIKEIGIRKVLGASVFSITQLLAKNFIVLIFISMLLAFPVAWYLMKAWLNDFSYRVNIEWWMFALVGASALFMALCTICFQAIKAAIANPVKSLRTE